MTATDLSAPPIWRNRIVGHGFREPQDFLANPKNWRVHPEFQQAAVLAVLQQIGIVQEVIVNEETNFLVDGHLRVALALQQKQPGFPVTLVRITEDEEDLILSVLDPLAALAQADQARLKTLLDRSTTTYQATQQLLSDLAKQHGIALANAQLPTVQEAPEKVDAQGVASMADQRAATLLAKWGVGVGQLWEIPARPGPGSHWLACGDSRQAPTLYRLMGGLESHLLLTSPPYGVGMEYEDAEPDFAATVALSTAVLGAAAPVVARDRFAFINFGERFTFPEPMGAIYVRIFAALGWRWYDLRQWRRAAVALKIWNTTQPRAMSQLEALYTFQRGGALYPVHNLELSKEPLWEAGGTSAGSGHPAVMAVGIAERALTIYTDPGERAVDPFSGIGTTVVAAARTGRLGYGQELEPRYVAIALERLSEMGLEPINRNPEIAGQEPGSGLKSKRKQAP